MNERDSELLRACRAGDRQAWETLVTRYQRLLYAIPLRCGLSEEDAADVFQTVCVRLLENLEKIRDERHLTGWLVTTCKHESWRVHRRRSRDVSLDEGPAEGAGGAGAGALADDSLMPQQVLVRVEEAHLVQRGLEELGERCRNLLSWLYQDDPTPSYQEIARRLNVSVGAIGPTRMRCLQQLKRILQRHGF